jgi:hypothetical protein
MLPLEACGNKANIKTSSPQPNAIEKQTVASVFLFLERAGLGLPLLAMPYAAAPPSNAIIM